MTPAPWLARFREQYLTPVTLIRLDAVVASLAGQVSDNADQVARMGRLSRLMHGKLDELQAAILARQVQGFDAAVALMLASSDQAMMDAIRHEIGGITEGEKALLRTRDAEVQADEQRMTVVAVLIGLASLLTRFAVEFYLTWRKRRLQSAKGRDRRLSRQWNVVFQDTAGIIRVDIPALSSPILWHGSC